MMLMLSVDEATQQEKKKKEKQLHRQKTEWTFFQRKYTDGQQVHEKLLNITNHQRNAN